MDFWSGLQSLIGGESSSLKNKTASGTGAVHRQEEVLAQKNAKLKEQLDAANARIAVLEKQLKKIKEEKTDVEQKFDTNKRGADAQLADSMAQIQDMIRSLDEKMQQLEGKTNHQMESLQAVARQVEEMKTAANQMGEIKEATKQIGAVKEAAGQIAEIKSSTDQIAEIKSSTDQIAEIKSSADQIGEIKTSMDCLGNLQDSLQNLDNVKAAVETLQEGAVSVEQMNEQAETLKTEISEKVHTENVKCYRNIKSLVTDLEVRMEQMELGDESLIKIRQSFKGMKFFSFFALLDFAALVFFVLYFMGYIVLP